MGTQALSVASPGQDIPADHHNELVAAFLQNIVPRNASRVATDLSGSLGTSALRWLRSYVETYHVGKASNNLTIYEGADNELWFQRNDASKELVKIKDGSLEFLVAGVVEFRITAAGIDWTTQNSRSIPFQKLNFTTIDCPVTNGSVLYYTTTAVCMVAFMPIGSRMEDDSPVGVYIKNHWVDTDGEGNNVFLSYSQGGASTSLNRDGFPGTFQMAICPAGREIFSYVSNSSDRVGGTLYVFPLG